MVCEFELVRSSGAVSNSAKSTVSFARLSAQALKRTPIKRRAGTEAARHFSGALRTRRSALCGGEHRKAPHRVPSLCRSFATKARQFRFTVRQEPQCHWLRRSVRSQRSAA